MASFGPHGKNFTLASNARRWPSELINGFIVSGWNQKYLLFGEQTYGAAKVKKWKKPCSFTLACNEMPQSSLPSPFQSQPVKKVATSCISFVAFVRRSRSEASLS